VTDANDENVDMRMSVTFTSSQSDQVTIRQPMLGMSPYVLIMPEPDFENHVLDFNVIACDFDKDELAQLFEMFAEALRSGRVTVEDEHD
jgi:hypothetical protein